MVVARVPARRSGGYAVTLEVAIQMRFQYRRFGHILLLVNGWSFPRIGHAHSSAHVTGVDREPYSQSKDHCSTIPGQDTILRSFDLYPHYLDYDPVRSQRAKPRLSAHMERRTTDQLTGFVILRSCLWRSSPSTSGSCKRTVVPPPARLYARISP